MKNTSENVPPENIHVGGEGRATDTHIERDETHTGRGDAEIGREPYDWEGEREREK